MKYSQSKSLIRQTRFGSLHIEPVLVDESGRILAAGDTGETHLEVFRRAFRRAADDFERFRLIAAFSNDAQHRFEVIGSDGEAISEAGGRPLTVNRFEAGILADASARRAAKFKGTPLQSEQIIKDGCGLN